MRPVYILIIACLLLSSCIVEVPVPVQAPAQRENQPVPNVNNEWEKYADTAAYQYALYLVAISEAGKWLDDGNLYGFGQEMAEGTRYLWNIANIDYPKDCRKCVELNIEVRKMAQAQEMLENFQDMEDWDFEYWDKSWSESKDRVQWLIEQ